MAKVSKWIDVSVPLVTGMAHWPGNPPVRITRTEDIGRGDVANVSALSLGAHTGTHMDAPLHFVRDGADIASMPPDATIGRARVVAVRDPECVRRRHLEGLRLRAGERVLFKTRNSTRCWKAPGFVEDFVYVSADAAAYLAERRVGMVGVDYLSVGGFRKDGRETHLHLLGAGIWVVEGLDLSRVRPGPVEFVCLPLKIAGGDGAPARAVLRQL